MLPLVDKPIIHYAVEESVQAGIEQVIIVTAIGKRAVEDYFDRSKDVEAILEAKGDAAGARRLRDISRMADVCFVRQGEMKGLGDAVMTARTLVDDEPFVLILPDDVMVGDPPATGQLLRVFDEYVGSVVAVETVTDAQVSSYGIVAGDELTERVTRLRRLIEKPRPHETPSRLAIVGRYLFTPAIFDAIERTPPGYAGEIQITDAMQLLADEEGMYAYRFEGARYDTGRPLALLTASIEMGLRRPDIAPDLREYLSQLAETGFGADLEQVERI